jgi:lipopolysaccharide export LptBFGC system permease protein LptF
VPNATLKIEQVVMSNLAKLVVHQIDQAHETHFGGYTIFAQDAYLAPPDPLRPNEDAVVLRGPLIVNYTTPPNPPDKWYHVAKDFYSAREAVAYIHQDAEEGTANVRIVLNNGTVFPRQFGGAKAEQGGLGSAQFGQIEIPSQLDQKTKFMNIFQLKDLERDPARGLAVRRVTSSFIHEDQANTYAAQLAAQLLSDAGQAKVQQGGDRYVIYRQDGTVGLDRNVITVTASPDGRPIMLRQVSSDVVRLTSESRTLKVTVDVAPEDDKLVISIDQRDALVDAGDTKSPKAELSRKLAIEMPQDIVALKGRTARQYLESNVRPEPQRQRLLFAWVDLVNHIRSELHARLAFVISCLLLVLVGAALGMMFRSGNFLTAFAVSVVPAMLSVVLIVTGQHTAENVPNWVRPDNNPLNAGITIIWAGNVIILVAAVVLMWRLQRK